MSSLDSSTLHDRKGWSADRRGSFTHRSELSDSLRRANTQETNRLQMKVQNYDKARDLAVNEISQQERSLIASTRGRRSSSPGPAIRAIIQDQLSAEKQKWKEKFKSFMTSDIKGTSSGDINIMGTKLFGSAEQLGTIRYYDDDVQKTRSNSKEEIHDDNTDPQENKLQNTNKGLPGRKLTREQIWRNLSQPKHPTTSLKQLRAKIESDVRKESWSKSNSMPRVQTLPHLAPESRGLIASADKGDRNSRSNKSMYLTVPNVIHTSKSDENLNVEQPKFESQRLDPDSSRVLGGNGFGSLPQRRRAKSLVVSSDHSPANTGTGNQIDLRLLLPPEVTNARPRSGSESSKGVNLIVPELRIHTSQ